MSWIWIGRANRPAGIKANARDWREGKFAARATAKLELL